MNGLRLSSSIRRWVAAGNNSAEGPTRTSALPLVILGRSIEAQGIALFARSLDPATVSALAAILGSFAGPSASTLSAWITIDGYPGQEDRSSRATVFRLYQPARAMVDAMQHKFD